MNDIMYELIKANEGLIYKIASKYSKYYNIEDLYQVGSIGIIKAYKKYREDCNAKFSTYAYNYIFGEMYALANNKEIKLNKDINIDLYRKEHNYFDFINTYQL